MTDRSVSEDDIINKKKKIIKAARKVFAQNGFHGSSVEEIARAAGVAKGSLYLYFENKQQLFIQVLLDILNRTDRIIGKAEKIKGGLWKKIKYISENGLEYFMDNKESFLIMRRDAQLNYTSGIKESGVIKEIINKRVHRLTSLFREGAKRGETGSDFTPRQSALFFLNLMDGMVLRIMEGWEEYPGKSSETMLKFFKKGLLE